MQEKEEKEVKEVKRVKAAANQNEHAVDGKREQQIRD